MIELEFAETSPLNQVGQAKGNSVKLKAEQLAALGNYQNYHVEKEKRISLQHEKLVVNPHYHNCGNEQ